MDRFQNAFDAATRNKADFYTDSLESYEKRMLANALPAMNGDRAIGSTLVEACARVRKEIEACEAQQLYVEQAELSIRAETTKIRRALRKVERNPTTFPDPVFFQTLWEDWQDRVFHPFIAKHKRPRRGVDRLWQVYDCLSDVEVQFMATIDAVQDYAAEQHFNVEAARQKSKMKPIQKQRKPKTHAPPPDDHKATTKPSEMTEDTSQTESNSTPKESPTIVAPPLLPPPNPTNYTTHDSNNSGSLVVGPPQLGSVIRRGVRSTPRIFTGSFSELEEGFHRLRSSRPRNPSDSALGQNQHIKIKDFATPSQGTPDTSSPSSPALQIPLRQHHQQTNDNNIHGGPPSMQPQLMRSQLQAAIGGPNAQAAQRPFTAHRAGSKSAGSSATVTGEPNRRPSSRNREHRL